MSTGMANIVELVALKLNGNRVGNTHRVTTSATTSPVMVNKPS